MNITESNDKAANALGGKTARPCDSCLLKRARWFCAADDAFLCQSCDSAVHSANQLASRHKRVRLETSSFKGEPSPAWHQGFTRKARTPRRPAKAPPPPASHQSPLVPEMNAAEDPFLEENEELLLYRVPVLEPFDDEFCGEIMKGKLEGGDDDHELNLAELLSGDCDEELAEFAADVESLLGAGAEEEHAAATILQHCNGTETTVSATVPASHDTGEFYDQKRVKVEEDDDEVGEVIACHFDPALDMELNWDFDEEMKVDGIKTTLSSSNNGSESQVRESMLMLRLNYEAVIAAWATQGSPWTDGIRPQFNLDEFMVTCLGGDSNLYGVGGRFTGINNAGREARVSRYKEKRRTRLFSKKIRYEVRKLNAEKRPRMKGRFVKRATCSGSSLPYLMNK